MVEVGNAGEDEGMVVGVVEVDAEVVVVVEVED
jgi:hypothetical protein